MKILFASSEVVPFSKTGGLADVSGALPKVIAKTEDITVITPLYNNDIISSYNLKLVGNKSFNMSNEKITVEYYGFKKDNVNYVFVKHNLFLRDALYGYLDDNKRFFIFSYSLLEYISLINKEFDLIHLNDWQVGIVPFLLKNHYINKPLYKNIKTLISIHNLQFQGSFAKETYSYTNLPFTYDYIHFDSFNFLKSGLYLADSINTVSNTYKEEIQTGFFGKTLDGLLRERSDVLYGIINGIDLDIYNPETDPYIPFKYNENKFVTGKRENKSHFLKQVGLDHVTGIPLISFISRLAEQKGIDLMMATLEEAITKSNANFAILGSGDSKYEMYFRALAHKYPNRVYTHIGFSNELAHLIYAASDIFLMPSLFEPCGLSQMISMRYGTLPIVRETGGLKDTVKPYNKFTNEGVGFSFANYNAHEFKDALLTAIHLYNNNQHVFRILQRQAMKEDFSQEKMGLEYINLYKKILNK